MCKTIPYQAYSIGTLDVIRFLSFVLLSPIPRVTLSPCLSKVALRFTHHALRFFVCLLLKNLCNHLRSNRFPFFHGFTITSRRSLISRRSLNSNLARNADLLVLDRFVIIYIITLGKEEKRRYKGPYRADIF